MLKYYMYIHKYDGRADRSKTRKTLLRPCQDMSADCNDNSEYNKIISKHCLMY